MKERINPYWVKSLAIHAFALIVATFIAFIALTAIGNKESSELMPCALLIALTSPLAYPLAGPYMVAFFLAAHISSLASGLLFGAMVALAYAAYLAVFLGAILHKSRKIRVGFSVILAAWFVLTLVGFLDWSIYWSA